MTWLNGPLAGYDSETTGVSVNTDRIVTACLGYAPKPGQWQPRNWLINPGVPIPPEATAVHGISDEQAAQGEDPKTAIARISFTLQKAWETGAPVIIYNAVFDLTLLDRELRRHLGVGLEINGPVIDPLVLDKHLDTYRKGSRKLVDVARHYGVTLTEADAHGAEADCFAAVRLAYVMIGHSELARLSLAELHDLQVQAYASQRASFFDYLRRKGDTPDDLNTVWPMAPYTEQEAAA